jgi:nucleotide-binding universal stress UspA family protein
MKRILVPVDFSGHTGITCRYALEFAKPFGGEIRLFHTYFDQILVADTSFPDTLDMSTLYNEGLMREIFKQAGQRMNALEEELSAIIREEAIGNITITTNVTGGEIEHELKGICREFHPDAVVMGTTGKGNNLNVWGKVSSFIIDHAKVPVITVPEIKKYRGFANIMFAADLSEGNAQAITGILNLFTPFSTKLHVVHFIKPLKQTDEYLRMKNLETKFAGAASENRIAFEMIEVTDDNQSAIDRVVSCNQIDMIAFQPHKHNLLYMVFTKNITKKNLFAANLPLLSVGNLQ